jgi:hypothetical protein
MKRVLLILSFVVLLSGSLNGEEKTWQPYQFKGSEHFKYSIEVNESGEVKKGFYQLVLKASGEEEVTLHLKAKLGKNSFESTVTAERENLYSSLMPQMMFNPATAPLIATLFAPWWGMYFIGHSWKVGSGWSYTDEEGKTVSFKIESECKYAGKKGKRVIWREDDVVKAEICVSEDVALPLSVYLKSDEDSYYKLVLEEYKE